MRRSWITIALAFLVAGCPPEEDTGGVSADAGAVDAPALGDGPIGEPHPIDAGPRPDAAPVSQDPIENTLAFAELPAEVVADTQIPVAGGPGAVPFSPTTEQLSDLVKTEAKIATDLTGREIVLDIRWGYVFLPPATWMWSDMSGYAAISDGSIELVRPLRFEDPAAGASRPHEDVVAAQTDPRVLRFSSTVGPGNDGLLVRIRRPVVRPVILVVRVGDFERFYLFDRLFDSSESVSNIDPDLHTLVVEGKHVTHDELCYSVAGSILGGFAIGSASNPVPGSLLGTFTATSGVTLDVVANSSENRLPYGAFSGTIGTTPFAGYWGRTASGRSGPVLAAVGDDDEPLRGVITGGWQGSFPATSNFKGTLFTRMPCRTAGARPDFPLDNPASGGF